MARAIWAGSAVMAWSGNEDRGPAALDRLLALRETVAEVIDLPTAARTRAMLTQARGVLADGRAAGNEAVDASCRQLTDELNVLSWLVPGTREFDDAIGAFRHHLFAHLELIRKDHPRPALRRWRAARRPGRGACS